MRHGPVTLSAVRTTVEKLARYRSVCSFQFEDKQSPPQNVDVVPVCYPGNEIPEQQNGSILLATILHRFLFTQVANKIPEVVCIPLMAELISNKSFPLSALGIIHIGNTIVQYEELPRVGEKLDMTCKVAKWEV